jgi:glycosyl transferase family 25
MDLIENIHIKNITNILKNIGERVEGNLLCDIYPDNWTYLRNISKIKNLQFMCKHKTKIIEIGVNACHSLIIMLLENPNAEYLLFDLNNHTYTLPIINYVKTAFPNAKINIIFGDSVQTISKYIIDNPHEVETYDFIHIDGCHLDEVFIKDYYNSKKLINNNGIIIFNDYDYINIYNFIQQKINENEIIEYKDSNIIDTNLHFIYQYKKSGFIDKIIYINLNKRTDRKEQIEKQLNDYGLNYERFEAIETPNFGILGCGLSHLAVLKIAKERNYENILILEDDFTFLVSKEEFQNQLTEFFKLKLDYDTCFLSYNLKKYEELDNTIVNKIVENWTASGYIVHNRYYEKLINLYEYAMPLLEKTKAHWIYANDQIWKELQQKDNWYYFIKRIGKQTDGYSDNALSYTTYNC